MPKIKTVRGAAKRFKKTASGGFKRKQSHLRHILTKKTTKRKRHLRHKSMVAKADQVAYHTHKPLFKQNVRLVKLVKILHRRLNNGSCKTWCYCKSTP